MRRSQLGAGGIFLVVVLLLATVVVAAVIVLARGSDQVANVNETRTKLRRAAIALEQYASAATRLPCPADPTLDTGDAVPNGASACANTTGTVPWRTIGLRREDAIDAWGRKLTYRVYTAGAAGGAGSLVQANGASMVACFTSATAGSGTDASGLCKADHTTSSSDFLAGKGLTLTDFGTVHGDTAFVVLSHGATGYGGYTVSGTQLPLPGGDELSNTRATGPFFIDPFSTPDTGVTSPQFFDDLLSYRSVSDLATHANLGSRNWPAPSTAKAAFDAATLSAALGKSVTPGDTGQTTIDLNANGLNIGARILGFSGSNANTDISYDTTNNNPGVGVVGNGTNLISSTGSEYIRFEFSTNSRLFGITFNDFGTRVVSGITYTEQVQFIFKKGGSTVLTVTKAACAADGALASFSLTAPSDFDSVEVHPLDATPAASPTQATQLAISAFNACLPGGSCTTTLATVANTCP